MAFTVTLPMIQSYGEHADFRCVRVQLGPITMWYSYATLVAFKVDGQPRVVTKNRWSNTTGRHLNAIDGGKRVTGGHTRVDSETFEKLWNQQVVPVLTAAAQAAAVKTAELFPPGPRRRAVICGGLYERSDHEQRSQQPEAAVV